MKKITGILTMRLPQMGRLSIDQVREFPFLALPSGEVMLEHGLSQLSLVADTIHIYLDAAFEGEMGRYARIAERYAAHLHFLNGLSTYDSLKEVSLQLAPDELILSLESGVVFPSQFSLPALLDRSRDSAEQGAILVFTANYLDVMNGGEITMDRNLRSLAFTDSSEAGFVSAAGKLLRWNGFLLLKNEFFGSLILEEKEEHLGNKGPGSSVYFDLEAPQACNLAGVMGRQVYSPTAFSLVTGDSPVYNFHINEDFQAYIEQLDHGFLDGFFGMVEVYKKEK